MPPDLSATPALAGGARVSATARVSENVSQTNAAPARPPDSSSFESLLAANALHLSTHAEKRLASRGTLRELGAPDALRLAEAVNRARQKGGRESLILLDNLAFIVDVQRRTVVTAMDSQSQKEGVFTNIDSVVLAK